VAGYVWGVLVSGLVVLFPSVLLLGMYAFYVAMLLVVAGIPIGVVGAVLTHLGCRDAPAQWMHVLMAGMWGYALTLLVTLCAGGDREFVLVVPTWVGIAAAIGRASVIGLVPDRQDGRAPR
jgi:hypothetical protein